MTKPYLRLRIAVTGMLFSAAMPALASDQCSLENGKTLYQKCAVCHTYDDSGAHGVVGPNLYRIVDRPVGKVKGYKFSSVMRKSSENWTIELLDAFLKQPMAVYPRTRMAFSGISKDQDRADLICYLSTQ